MSTWRWGWGLTGQDCLFHPCVVVHTISQLMLPVLLTTWLLTDLFLPLWIQRIWSNGLQNPVWHTSVLVWYKGYHKSYRWRWLKNLISELRSRDLHMCNMLLFHLIKANHLNIFSKQACSVCNSGFLCLLGLEDTVVALSVTGILKVWIVTSDAGGMQVRRDSFILTV